MGSWGATSRRVCYLGLDFDAKGDAGLGDIALFFLKANHDESNRRCSVQPGCGDDDLERGDQRKTTQPKPARQGGSGSGFVELRVR